MEFQFKGLRRKTPQKIKLLNYSSAILEGFHNVLSIEPQHSVVVKSAMHVYHITPHADSGEEALRQDFDRIGFDLQRSLQDCVVASKALSR